MKANTFYRRKLHNLEHFQYAATVLKMAQEANVEKLTATLPPLSAAVTAEDEVNNAQRKVNDSDELKALHKERERAFRSLTTKIEDAKLSDEKAEEAAGKRLDLILKRYPKPSKNNYDITRNSKSPSKPFPSFPTFTPLRLPTGSEYL